MKALQTRSPIILYYNATDLNEVALKIWLEDNPQDFDITNTPAYELESKSINEVSKLEISELIRSANQYEYKENFYTIKDTATNVLVQATLIDFAGDVIDLEYKFMRVRDGYVDRTEDVQFFENMLPVKVNEWGLPINATFTDTQTDEFNGSNAVLVEATNAADTVSITNLTDGSGVYTFSVYVNETNIDTITLGFDNVNTNVTFDLSTDSVSSVGSNVLGYDIYELANFKRLSISVDATFTSTQISFASVVGGVDAILFNPSLVQGNWLHVTPEELFLQDNSTSYWDGINRPQVIFDRKSSITYDYGLNNLKTRFENNPQLQASVSEFFNLDLEYTNLDNTLQIFTLTLVEICEPKYTPVKISFVNRFGVVQDLIFFKKRVDSYQTKSESYKANTIQGKTILSTIGQKKVFNKKGEAKVTLSSGFYPESFNNVFKQLLYAELVWIDDEPAVISNSSWTEKTSLNDKLINYNLDFEYGNNDINNIR